MKLYREYKEEQGNIRREENDREKIGAEENVVIIYEESGVHQVVKTILQFVLFLLAICAAAACFIFGFK